jgi:signal peptidase I
MALVLVVSILLAITLGNVALVALFLWVACRVARIPGVTYRRALLTAFVLSLLGTAGSFGVLALRDRLADQPALELTLLLAFVAAPFVAVQVIGKASFGRILLAGVIWCALTFLGNGLLVLGIRAALTEAFVVPTGAMAETVLGYHKTVQCPQCGYQFPVNCSQEVDPQEGRHAQLTGCTCPNCRFFCDLDKAGGLPFESGDCLLASKGLMSIALRPARFDLIVFTYPGDEFHPQGAPGSGPPLRYVKRLVGLPGETVGIHYGKLYMGTGAGPAPEDRAAAPESLHLHRYMHEDECRKLLEHPGRGEPGKVPFQILRKSPEAVLALRRLVYDNDHQASDLSDLSRWTAEPGAGWTADQARGFRSDGKDATGTAWLHYRHLLRPGPDEAGAPRPQLITDFMGYNAFESDGSLGHHPPPQNWVGDLILECEAAVGQPAGDLRMEVARGVDRFQARWDLASGTCTLVRERAGKEETLGSAPAPLNQSGTHRLRLANVDERITVWVDDQLPFGDGVVYEPAPERGPTADNDLRPAGIGARGAAVSVHHLKLWRDTYYTLAPGSGSSDSNLSGDDWADPSHWEPLGHLPAKTFFVQPGHYFCLGDNSPESSDSRSWGVVPERLLEGRVLCRYYPLSRAGLVR